METPKILFYQSVILLLTVDSIESFSSFNKAISSSNAVFWNSKDEYSLELGTWNCSSDYSISPNNYCLLIFSFVPTAFPTLLIRFDKTP